MLYCYSINHNNAPLAVRENLSFTPDEQIAWLTQQEGAEAVLLVTCNRVELYTEAADPQDIERLWGNLLHYKHLDPAQFIPYTARMRGYEAALHLFQVAGSLKSMVLGESQILGQVATALEFAQHKGTCGHTLSMTFRAALHAAKRVQHETQLGHGQVSVSSLGIHQMEQVLGNLAHRPILVIGAGEMGQAVIKGLKNRRAQQITLLSRTYERAQHIAETWQIAARPMTDLEDMLAQAEIVFSTSSAPFPILASAELAPIMTLRGQRAIYLVDLAVPRDVEPEVAHIEGVHLYNLEKLALVIHQNTHERAAAIPHAQAILDEELTKLWQAYESQSVVPTIRQLREHVEQIRQSELGRIMNRLPAENSDEVRLLLEEFSHRFMNKVLHHPTHHLKTKASQGTGTLFTTLTRDLFGLEDVP